jgi:hypothetical protein
MILCFGLGGVVAKNVSSKFLLFRLLSNANSPKTVGILYERLYDPSMQILANTLRGLVFLGTPHPSYRKPRSSQKLDTVTLAMGFLSKKMREKIAAEAAIVSNISQKFLESTFPHGVITGYELQPTKVQTGMLRSRKEIVSDATPLRLR